MGKFSPSPHSPEAMTIAALPIAALPTDPEPSPADLPTQQALCHVRAAPSQRRHTVLSPVPNHYIFLVSDLFYIFP